MTEQLDNAGLPIMQRVRNIMQSLRERGLAVAIGERSVQAREDKADARELTADGREDRAEERQVTADGREDAIQHREDAVLSRETTVHLREDAARAKEELDAFLMKQLQQANENLVIASLRAQTLAEAADHASVLKEQFLAMLAHEMRNPLAPIVNALEVLHRVKTSDPMVPWAHDIIHRQVSHMTRLVNDLLDVSRINTGKIELQNSAVSVEDIMRQALESSEPSIRGRKQTLDICIPPRPLYIHGDLVRLVQVFTNLLNNAGKYTQEGGTIRFSAQHQQNDRVIFRVSDNGCGITAEALPDVFKLFTQEDRSLVRSRGGLGIGLTVARGIIEMHGGIITARSDGADKGSEFEVDLPLMEQPVPADLSRAVPPLLASVSYRILVIEDNVDAAASMKMLLDLMGHQVHTATDGEAGLKLALAERPHIILFELGPPVMDGYEVVVRTLRETMPHPQPMLIAATGYGRSEDAERVSAAGFDSQIVKPVRVEDLLRVISLHADRLLPPEL